MPKQDYGPRRGNCAQRHDRAMVELEWERPNLTYARGLPILRRPLWQPTPRADPPSDNVIADQLTTVWSDVHRRARMFVVLAPTAEQP